MKIKHILLLFLMTLFHVKTTFSQSGEQFFIGTQPGEIIIQKPWYEYTFMGYKCLFCKFTNHGADIDIIATYDTDNWVIDSVTMAKMGEPLYDATPGHFYNIDYLSERILSTEDYGQTWIVIDDYTYPNQAPYWCFANELGELVKFERDYPNPQNYSFIASYDYGAHFSDTIATFPIPVYTNHVAGWNHGEFFRRELGTDKLLHTTDFYGIADTLTLPAEYINKQFGIGPKEGELYFTYMPYSKLRRVEYTDNYGNSFRTLVDLESNPIDVIVDDSVFRFFDIGYGGNLFLDREPGVFYVCLDTLSYNFTEWGTPVEEPQGDRCYIAYYRAYGDTLVTTYFHDFKPDWFEHHTPVMDCEIASCDESSVTLRWNEPELKPDEVLVGYQVYRGATLVGEDLITETDFTDDYSGGGRLNYHVLAVYSDGDTSRSYNIVYCEQTDDVGESGYDDAVTINPNPANGLVRIDGMNVAELRVCNILGQTLKTIQNSNTFSVSGLPAGLYLLRITDGEGATVTRRIVVK